MLQTLVHLMLMAVVVYRSFDWSHFLFKKTKRREV